MRQELAENLRARALALLAPLDDDQRVLARATRGAWLGLGAAGTGKSRTLAHHLAYLVIGEEAPPRRLLVLAGSERGAELIRARAERLTGGPLHGAWFGTFRGTGQRILRAHPGAGSSGKRRALRMVSDAEARTILRKVAREADLDLERFTVRRLQDSISAAKNELRPPSTPALVDAYQRYEQALTDQGVLDADDVFLRVLRLLDEDDALLQRYRRRFEHVLVDDVEEMTPPQRALLAKLLGPSGAGNLLMVGDDDEAVGPAPDLEGLARDLGATVLPLRHAWRSSGRITYVADRLIRYNLQRLPKDVVQERKRGRRVVGVTFPDAAREAELVVRWIRRMRDRGEAHLSRTAILYRQGVQARLFEEELVKAGLPYHVASGRRFFERREIRDLLSYLRLSVAGGDPRALARVANVPRRGIGPASVRTLARLQATWRIGMAEAALKAAELPRVTAQRAGALADLGRLLQDLDAAARTMEIAELIAYVVERAGYEQHLAELPSAEEEGRREGIDELVQLAREYVGPAITTLDQLFERVAHACALPWAGDLPGGEETDDGPDAVDDDREAAERRGEGVQLMTLRVARGREFDVVFLSGFEEGLLPHARAVQAGDAAVETERRLAYIGVSRARVRLFLTRAVSRVLGGQRVTTAPSRFLLEAGRRVRRFHLGGGAPVEPAVSPDLGPSLLEVTTGQRVAHDRYGAGVVNLVEESEKGPTAVVNFDNVGEKRLLVSLARLRPA